MKNLLSHINSFKGISLIILISFQFLFTTGFAQQNDFGLWTSVSLEKGLHKKLDLEIGQKFRFDNNVIVLIDG